MSAERRVRIGWVMVGLGTVLFPILWLAFVMGHAAEYRTLMRFLARSDAHVFFDLPGSLRAYEILFAALPAAGTGLVAGGVFLIRRWSVTRSALAGIGVGAIVLVLAAVVTP
jgi:hypothetical protein